MATFLIVRHGEAEGNRDHRFIGQSDVQLSPVGRRQAEAVSARLAQMPVERIVSSDLRRAVDTVLPAATELGLTIDQDPRFREIDNGDWRGLLADEIAERWPALWTRYTSGEDVTRPNGETWADVRRRVIGALREIATESPAHSLVMLSAHGGPALALASWACGLHPKGNLYQVPLVMPWNASITVIRAPNPRLISFNDVGHLPLELQRSADLGFLRA
ncbi:MAG: histidine phosphatase family protein [Gammaproteobacteria bacterium]|nr:histidine phosphatase family protein [Gammaproteobacteria bacterium]